MAIHGNCHCGNVAYTLDAEPREATECNCSICRRKGYILAFASPDQFTLETPREALTTYTFGNHAIQHMFCKTCGCAPFGEGKGPDGQDMVAINLRCAENTDLSQINVAQFDGASL